MKPGKIPTQQAAFRLPTELLKRIDRHLFRLRIKQPGFNLSRSDAVRSLLARALDEAEAADKP